MSSVSRALVVALRTYMGTGWPLNVTEEPPRRAKHPGSGPERYATYSREYALLCGDDTLDMITEAWGNLGEEEHEVSLIIIEPAT